jgi:ferredoxin
VLQWLKKVRVTFAIGFFLVVTFLFLDFGNIIPSGLCTFLVSIQLVPSLIRSLMIISSVSLGLIFILLLTIFIGRVYCSTVCPLGIVQDIIIRVARRINRRRRFRFKKPPYIIHYLLFFLTVLFAFSGSLFLLNLFEPFSNYGRILSNLVSPSVVLANNAIVDLFSLFSIIFLYQISLLHITLVSILAPLGFLGLIVYLSYNHGRLFCNLLCPAGALLGLLSRFSFYKIEIDKNNCKECGLCERVCKANCINSDSMTIDFAACIGCFNCIDACPTVGMSYHRRWKKTSILLPMVNEGRRIVLRTSIVPVLGMLLPEISTNDSSETISHREFDESHRHPISPPGSISVEHFSSRCTACHLCISSCPTQVLIPTFFDYGIAGIFQPKMNYSSSYCNFDCVICGQVCPTGAILPLDTNRKKQVQIGRVRFNKDDCIVVTKKRDCGACSEHCPTKAVRMVPYEQRLVVPEVDDEICIGCGACEHACPVQPRKAIYVHGNLVHSTAKKPKSEKIELSFDNKQDFPF